MCFRPTGACRCGLPIPVAGFETLAVRGWGFLWGEFHFGDVVGEGLLVGALLCSWRGRRLGHLVFWLLWGFCFL